jgi:MobA/MobL family
MSKAQWRTYMFCEQCALPGAGTRMAIFHLSASIIGRSAGRTVTAAAAYRAATKIEDRTTGEVHNYSRKQGVDHSEIISPIAATSENEWLTDREELWNKVEQNERRKDAQLAREVTVAIPCELPRSAKISLVREYVEKTYVAAGMIADVNLHHLDSSNPHAHILLTMRNLETTPEGTVKFGLKNTDWNSKDLLLTQRKNWEDAANQYLADHGVDSRIDCRSLKDQGIERIPQIHIGVHAMGMESKGISTERGNLHRQITHDNLQIAASRGEIFVVVEEITKVSDDQAAERREEQKRQREREQAIRQLDPLAQMDRMYARVDEVRAEMQKRRAEDAAEFDRLLSGGLKPPTPNPPAQPKEPLEREQAQAPRTFQEMIDFYKGVLVEKGNINVGVSSQSGKAFRDIAEIDPRHHAQLGRLASNFEVLGSQVSMPVNEFIKTLEGAKKLSEEFLVKCDLVKDLNFDQWYKNAKAIGKSSEYLDRITEISRTLAACYGDSPTVDDWKRLQAIRVDNIQPSMDIDQRSYDARDRSKQRGMNR